MLVLLTLSLVLGADPAPSVFAHEGEISEEIRDAELQAHVYRLCSPEFLGRKGQGAERAGEHIAATFRKIGLKPAFNDSFFQPIPWLVGSKGGVVGRNVGGMIPGTDPALQDEWILLAAHHDHLGERGGAFYPGADDNASAVAMLMEVAERFALQKSRPRRTLVFVSFDLEEQGLQGSTHFAAHSPLPFRKLKTMIVGDLVGRSMAGVMDEYVFAMGAESSPGLKNLISVVPPDPSLKVGRMGADLVGTRSDYGPFRDRRIPFLFITTGTHADYHRVTDVPEKIDYPKLAKVSRWVADLAEKLRDDPSSPGWDPIAAPDFEEAKTTMLLLARVLSRSEAMNLSEAQKASVQKCHDRLAEIVGRGKITAEERSWLVWQARWLMASVF